MDGYTTNLERPVNSTTCTSAEVGVLPHLGPWNAPALLYVTSDPSPELQLNQLFVRMESPTDLEKLPLYRFEELTEYQESERTTNLAPTDISPPSVQRRLGWCSSQSWKTFRDITLGFLLATICWKVPALRRTSSVEPVNTTDPFPSGTKIGYQGPTKVGAEPFAAVTAPAAPALRSYFPLVSPAFNSKKSFDPVRSWGYLSPFYSLPPSTFGLHSSSSGIPGQCQLHQVYMLHRHGARYPTSSKEPAGFADRLKAAQGFKASGKLEFLNNWNYTLGTEILTPFGRNQLFNLGVGFREKYGHLLDQIKEPKKKLVFRTTSQHRMLHSALNFAAGFFGLPFEQQYHQSILIEAKGFNNTLAPYFTCNNSKEARDTFAAGIMANWSRIYLAKTLPRLQKDLEGYNLTFQDLVSMQQLCAYETVSLGWSPMCNLFTTKEFKGFDYYSDRWFMLIYSIHKTQVSFWYAYSFGSPYAAAIGKGWVQELLSRLTQEPIEKYDSSTNSTLDSDPVTFPLDQPIYVDATHDTVISCIIVALNLTTLASEGPLPTTHIPKKQSFVSSHISPFAANLQTQIVECSGEKKIRFLLNDAPVPLTGLKGCLADKHGFCSLPVAIEALKERIEEIDYQYDCNVDHHYAPPIGGGGIIDGRPPRHGSR